MGEMNTTKVSCESGDFCVLKMLFMVSVFACPGIQHYEAFPFSKAVQEFMQTMKD